MRSLRRTYRPAAERRKLAHSTGGAAPGAAAGVAAFFDIDRTLIAGASALHFARPFRRHGLVTHRQQLRAVMLGVVFAAKGADNQGMERFGKVAGELIRGWPQDEVRSIVEQEYETHIRPVVFREALDRIAMHHRMGHPVIAVSATVQDIVEPLGEMIGLDEVLGSQLEVVGGQYTGVMTEWLHGEAKAERVRAYAQEHGFDLERCYGYSDSISDEPFLRCVGRPYAVNPDRDLRELAVKEGWGMLSFRTRTKVKLHQRRSVRIAAASAAIAGATAAIARMARRK